MEKINKTVYWIALLVLFTFILVIRYLGYFTDIGKEFYYSIFGLWICLILLPLFSEMEFLGIKLKKELSNLKNEVKSEIQSIKYEIHNTNRQQVFLGYGPPPSDVKITELEKEVRNLEEKYKLKVDKTDEDYSSFINVLKIKGIKGRFDVPDSTLYLFQIRFKLEELITKIWSSYQEYLDLQNDRFISPIKMLRDLKQIEVIDNNIIELTKDILSICNAAVHGKNVSEKQVDFVIKNARTIYDTLSDIIHE